MVDPPLFASHRALRGCSSATLLAVAERIFTQPRVISAGWFHFRNAVLFDFKISLIVLELRSVSIRNFNIVFLKL